MRQPPSPRARPRLVTACRARRSTFSAIRPHSYALFEVTDTVSLSHFRSDDSGSPATDLKAVGYCDQRPNCDCGDDETCDECEGYDR